MRKFVTGLLALICAAFSVTSANAGVVFIPIVIPIPVQVPSAQTGGYDKIHNVAVISAIGTKLALKNHRFFGDRSFPLDISAWKVDDAVDAMMRQYLGGRFTFKDVPFDRAAL